MNLGTAEALDRMEPEQAEETTRLSPEEAKAIEDAREAVSDLTAAEILKDAVQGADLDMAGLRHYAELHKTKKDLEAQAKAISEEMRKLEPDLLEQMASAGVDNFKFGDIGATVYVGSRIWAKVADKQAAIEALKAAGLTEFVAEGYNHNTLSSYVSEASQSEEGLPPEFTGVIEANEVFRLGVRGA